MADIEYRVIRSGTDQMFASKTAPIQLYLANIGREMEGEARRRVGFRTGTLKRSIGSRLVPKLRGKGWDVEVFADTPYATYHHEGTKPHPIPKTRVKGKFLVFPGTNDWEGQTIVVPSVNHPGHKANRFLVDAATYVGLKVRRR